MDYFKLRIKDPSGAEFEAEGPAEFILTEKENFLKDLLNRKTLQELSPAISGPNQKKPENDFWDNIVESKGALLRLRIKSPGVSAEEAALILIAAYRFINQKEEVGAITLSKILRSSGYEPDRLDRLLSLEIREGRVTASGTKRNRTYRITQKGLEKTYRAINRIAPD
jgi:hypothetical protein